MTEDLRATGIRMSLTAWGDPENRRKAVFRGSELSFAEGCASAPFLPTWEKAPDIVPNAVETAAPPVVRFTAEHFSCCPI